MKKVILFFFFLHFLSSCTSPLSTFQLHILDLPNSEVILLELDNEYILINTGNKESYTELKEYLNQHSIDTLRYLILTQQQVGYDDNTIALTKDYTVQQVLTNHKYDYPTRNVSNKEKLYVEDLILTFYTNNKEVSLHLQYKNHNFLLLSSTPIEEVPKVDVLKISSTTPNYMKIMNITEPKILVVNDQLPTTMKKLEAELASFQGKYVQTSKQGTIVIQTDGKNLLMKVEND